MRKILFLLCSLMFFVINVRTEDLRNSQEKLISAEWIYSKANFDENGLIEGELLIRIKDGWYTYAQEPGDTGMPPRIKFLNVEAVDLEGPFFPPAKEYKHSAGVSYGYDGTFLIKFQLRNIPDKKFSGFKIIYEGLLCDSEKCKPFELIVDVFPPEHLKNQDMKENWMKILKESGWGETQN